MDDKELQKQQKQAEIDKASQKAAHVAGKALATYYGGAVGNKIANDLSNTEVGRKIEESVGKQLQKSPLAKPAMHMLDKSGVLDKADQAVDIMSKDGDKSVGDGVGKDAAKSTFNNTPIEAGDSAARPSGSIGSKNNFMNNLLSGGSGSDTNSDNSVKTIDLKTKFKILMTILPPVLVLLIGAFFIILVVTVISYPFEAAGNFFKGVWNKITGIFTGDKASEEEGYYQELKTVQEYVKSQYNICIDINLITASLTVNRTLEDIIDNDQGLIEQKDENGNIIVDENNNVQYVTDTDSNGNEVSYKKMQKQVKLLANMQVMIKKYGLDEGLYNDTGSYCIKEDSSYEQYELINSENLHNYKTEGLFSENGLDSSSYDLIAQHDMSSFDKFFTKKVNEEKNYAYYFYRPYYDENGKCDDELPDDELEVSIGNFETRDQSVFYWNLINSFIPDYYANYLPKDPVEKEKKIREIANEIYILYDEMGPSQTCYVNSSYICRNDEGAGFYGGGDQKLSLQEFTQNVSPIAIEEMTRTGIFSSITLSQAALESANGASGLSKNYSNYYGMTAGSCAPSQSPDTVTGSILQPGESGNKCTGNQFWNGSIVALCNSQGEDCQWYRIYDSFLNSTRDHSRLLAQAYGCNVYNTYSEQLDCLVSHGYATDPKYKEKIINVISTNNLASYDIGTFSGTYQDISQNSFVNNICSGDGVVTYAGEFTSWKQYDARWKTVKLGTSTVGKIGCAMTSVTIQILRAGVENILGANLNPGTFATTLTDLGGFTPGGGIYWASAAKIAPNFQFVDAIRRYAPPSEIAQKVNQGYFVILNVKNGRHWVAVDRVEGDKIYMFDPGSGGNEVGNVYGLNSIVGYVYYRRG